MRSWIRGSLIPNSASAYSPVGGTLERREIGRTGSGAREWPLPSAGRFGSDAVSIKEAVVAAYIGQSGNLTPGAVLDIARITAVEARHASWLLDIVGRLPAPSSADTASSQRQVTAVLRRLGLAKGG